MIFKFSLIILFFICICHCSSFKPKATLDKFFNYTWFSSLTLSSNDGQSILIQTTHRIWDRNINEEHLYLQTLRGENRTLITTKATFFKPQWKDDLIALILQSSSRNRHKQKRASVGEPQYIHLYSIQTNQMYPLLIGNEEIHIYTWSATTRSLYFATRTPWSIEQEQAYTEEWKDVIEYREQYRGDINENMTISNIELLANISLPIDELIYSPDGKQLVFSTEPLSLNQEHMADYELYSLDLTKQSPLIPSRLTNNLGHEINLKWSVDNLLFFTITGEGSIEGPYEDSQGRLYSLNMTSKRIERWASQFNGEVTNYALLQGGRQGIIILGQLSIEIQVYLQHSPSTDLIKQTGWNGSYQHIVTVTNSNSTTIAFIHSSFEAPQEIYFVDNIDQLNIAQAVTSENKLFTERNLPRGKSYRWLNEDDKTEIEGVLLYPPDKFEEKNLTLLVLIHGGSYVADLNIFRADYYYCGVIMATEGWLVLQPNYRGSSGYGDEFLRNVRFQILSRPGKDILYGVDALVKDGIVDPKRLTIGGYSYGGYLTNWLITQTTRFNAAISGAAAVEHVADWGLTDIPWTSVYFFGGYPWEVPNLYHNEAPIFQMDKVRTPTHIVVPGNDVRVPSAGNFILERALTALNIPTKVIILPGEPHSIGINPWHEKLKTREELKWLQKYGNITVSSNNNTLTSTISNNNTLNSAISNKAIEFYTFIFLVFAIFHHFEK